MNTTPTTNFTPTEAIIRLSVEASFHLFGVQAILPRIIRLNRDALMAVVSDDICEGLYSDCESVEAYWVANIDEMVQAVTDRKRGIMCGMFATFFDAQDDCLAA